MFFRTGGKKQRVHYFCGGHAREHSGCGLLELKAFE
jgi:hypothetical protein